MEWDILITVVVFLTVLKVEKRDSYKLKIWLCLVFQNTVKKSNVTFYSNLLYIEQVV